MGTKIQRCSSPLHKRVQYLHITFAHPPGCFNSSLEYLRLIQCKIFINTTQMLCKQLLAWQIQVQLFGTFWNFVFPNIFNPQLVDSTDVEPEDAEGQLYIDKGSQSIRVELLRECYMHFFISCLFRCKLCVFFYCIKKWKNLISEIVCWQSFKIKNNISY